MQHDTATFPDKGSYSKHYLLSILYKTLEFVMGISEYPVYYFQFAIDFW